MIVAETGDILDARLREGNAHTAEGGLEFILDHVDRVEGALCQVALARIDAGFPDEKLLCGLERRGTPYVARRRNNKVLKRMARPFQAAGGPPPGGPACVVSRDDLRLDAETVPAAELLELYRQRRRAEA